MKLHKGVVLTPPVRADIPVGCHYQHLGIGLHLPEQGGHAQRLEGLAHTYLISQQGHTMAGKQIPEVGNTLRLTRSHGSGFLPLVVPLGIATVEVDPIRHCFWQQHAPVTRWHSHTPFESSRYNPAE